MNPKYLLLLLLLLPLANDLRVAEDKVLLVLDLHLRATVLGQEDLVSGLDADGHLVALLVESSRTGADDRGRGHLALGLLGQDNATLGHRLWDESLDEDAIQKRNQLATDGSLPRKQIINMHVSIKCTQKVSVSFEAYHY